MVQVTVKGENSSVKGTFDLGYIGLLSTCTIWRNLFCSGGIPRRRTAGQSGKDIRNKGNIGRSCFLSNMEPHCVCPEYNGIMGFCINDGSGSNIFCSAVAEPDDELRFLRRDNM